MRCGGCCKSKCYRVSIELKAEVSYVVGVWGIMMCEGGERSVCGDWSFG